MSMASRSSRSRMAFWYSVRFRRWNAAVLPGLTRAAAARSSSVSSDAIRPSSTGRSGRGAPAGGIVPACSFRTTFSHAAPSAATRCVSTVSSSNPPAFDRALWQVTQYVFKSARRSSAALAADACASGRSFDGEAGPVAWSGLAAGSTGPGADTNAIVPARLTATATMAEPASLLKCGPRPRNTSYFPIFPARRNSTTRPAVS